jgi:hypothetical protein
VLSLFKEPAECTHYMLCDSAVINSELYVDWLKRFVNYVKST